MRCRAERTGVHVVRRVEVHSARSTILSLKREKFFSYLVKNIVGKKHS